jgi:hypothetical protein
LKAIFLKFIKNTTLHFCANRRFSMSTWIVSKVYQLIIGNLFKKESIIKLFNKIYVIIATYSLFIGKLFPAGLFI